MTETGNPPIGPLFQDWLKFKAIAEEVNAAACPPAAPGSTASSENGTVSLPTLARAAEQVGRKLTLELM